jgi:hypothetical protein
MKAVGLLKIITKNKGSKGSVLFYCPDVLDYLKGMERLLNESTTVEE